MGKKAWEKPQLIILSRGRSEEKVLFGCKGEGGFGPFLLWNGCRAENGGTQGPLCDILWSCEINVST